MFTETYAYVYFWYTCFNKTHVLNMRPFGSRHLNYVLQVSYEVGNKVSKCVQRDRKV